jgi:hypothetical protein
MPRTGDVPDVLQENERGAPFLDYASDIPEQCSPSLFHAALLPRLRERLTRETRAEHVMLWHLNRVSGERNDVAGWTNSPIGFVYARRTIVYLAREDASPAAR